MDLQPRHMEQVANFLVLGIRLFAPKAPVLNKDEQTSENYTKN